MRRDMLRVEPISTFLGRFGAPASPVVRLGELVFVSTLPPFDPKTGEVRPVCIELQTERVLEQMERCLDWSERRPHLAGAVGAALAARCVEAGWVEWLGVQAGLAAA